MDFSTLIRLFIVIIAYKAHHIQALNGPSFINEPPSKMEFSNSTGTSVICSARGNPPPSIQWTLLDGTPAILVPGLREILPNGTLFFPSFPAEAYRQDIHAISYRCVASNPFGTIVSRAVNIRAVVLQYYEVQVYDEYVIRGNTAIIKCHIPSFVKDYVTVTSWVKYSATRMTSDITGGGRYSVFPTGELHIRNAGSADSFTSYRCRARHRLTGETRLSGSQGRLVVSDPQNSVPPRITDSRPILSVREGDTVELPCSAQGLPVPRYRWLKADRTGENPLLIGQRFTQLDGSLVIRRVGVPDSGKYVCIVSNSVGEERVETDLIVTAPLFVYVQPERQTVDIGRTAVFNCSVTGHPINLITWLKDGRTLVGNGKRVQLKSPTRLVIRSVKREDEGKYQCFAENLEESAQGTAELSLGEVAPLLLEVFTEQFLKPGQAGSIRCVATGTPRVMISWTVDGYPIRRGAGILSSDFVGTSGETISYVNVTRASVEDGGYYECLASNSAGSVRHGARVNVYGAPFVKSMKNVSAVAMDNVMVQCRVGGYPIEAIHWEQNGRRIPFNHRQKVYPNGTLHITTVNPSVDGGMYVCIAEDKQGKSAQGTIFITIRVPPLIERFSFDDNLHEGMRTRVYCNIAQGDPPVSIAWLKDGRPIPADLGVIVREIDSYSVSLAIDKISPKHNGNYTCVASNSAAVVNHTAQLIVDVPPRWVKEPKNSFVVEGNSVILDCLVEGHPLPQVTWKKASGDQPTNYHQLWSGPHFQIYENGTLRITKAAVEDRGYYLCQATNGIGTGLSAVVSLSVNVPARLLAHHRNQSTIQGRKTRLPCEAVGDPPLDFLWKKDGEELRADKSSRISVEETSSTSGVTSAVLITSPNRSDSGSYACYVSNAFGKDKAIIHLIVQEPPESPKEVTASEVTSRSVLMSWQAPYDGLSPITAYIVQVKNTSAPWDDHTTNVTIAGDEIKAFVTSLQPARQYDIRILARNSVGLSNPSHSVNITTSEEVPGGPPRDVRVQAVGPHSLRVTWKPPREDLRHGVVKGYYVGYNIANSSEPYLYKTLEADKEFSNQCALDGLRTFTTYSILVQAYNAMGAGPRSDEVLATTLEDAPTMPPESVQCTSATSQSIRVSWLPPPATSVNGRLLGFRIRYQPVQFGNDNEDKKIEETKETKITLKHLLKFTNYSIQVMAFNRAGNGASSEPLYCRTNEDVPEEPSAIKALVTSEDAILISWKPPVRSNGIIRKYTVYIRTSGTGGANTTAVPVPPSMHYHKATDLSRGRRYEFWVTASTGAGEGDATRVVAQTPSKWAAARIASFPDQIIGSEEQNIELPCRAVGHPEPTREWRLSGKPIEENERIKLLPTGSLRIDALQESDAGNYTCYVHNVYGADEVLFVLAVKAGRNEGAPPPPPSIDVESVTSSSITVSLRTRETKGNIIKAHELYFKRPYGEWEHVLFMAGNKTYTLRDVQCGSQYQLYMVNLNKVAKSEPSDVVTTRTEGREPIPPEKSAFIIPNSTSITLHLNKWRDGGCPMSHLAIDYRRRGVTQWTVVTNKLRREEGPMTLHDLKPQTWYQIKVTAYNSAGSTVAEYDIQTLPLKNDGANKKEVIPNLIVHNETTSSFYEDAAIIVPVVISAIVLISLAVLLAILGIRKRRPGIKGNLTTNNLSAEPALCNAVRKGNSSQNCNKPLSSLSSFSSRPIDCTTYDTVEYPVEENLQDACLQRKTENKTNRQMGEKDGQAVYSVAQRIGLPSQKSSQPQNSAVVAPRYATSEEFLSLIQQRRQDGGGTGKDWTDNKESNFERQYFHEKERADVYPLCQFSNSPSKSGDRRQQVCITPEQIGNLEVDDDEFHEQMQVSKTRHWVGKARGNFLGKKSYRDNGRNQCDDREENVRSFSTQ